MVRNSKTFQIDDRPLTWEIRVFGEGSPIDDELEALRHSWAKSGFINELPMDFDNDGTPKPTITSNIGSVVPILSRELWLSGEADYIGSIKTAVRHIWIPRSPVGDGCAPAKQCDKEELIRFLIQPEFVANLQLWVVAQSNMQFKIAQVSSSLADSIIQESMKFSKLQFGSFASERIFRQHKKMYKEAGFIQIGFMGQEESR
jgi:hypothetical protein